MKNQNELKEVVPDILPALKQLPNFEDMKNPAKESLNLQDLLNTQTISANFDKEVEELNPEEQKEYFKNQYQTADNLDSLLDESKLFEIQKIAVNLKKSWHNFVTKKKRLVEFKTKLN